MPNTQFSMLHARAAVESAVLAAMVVERDRSNIKGNMLRMRVFNSTLGVS